MDIEVQSIFEKEMLVVKGWTPDESLLMHVASLEDQGAALSDIKETVEYMQSIGDHPVRIKFQLMWNIEVIEDYGEE